MKNKCLMTVVLLLVGFSGVAAEEEALAGDTLAADSMLLFPAPVANLEGRDSDNDHGHSVDLSWELSSDDGAGQRSVMKYEIFRWIPTMMDSADVIRSAIGVASAAREIDEIPDADWNDTLRYLRNVLDTLLFQFIPAHAGYPNNGEWRRVGIVPSGTVSFEHSGPKDRLSPDFLPDYCDFYFRVDAVTSDESIRTSSDVAGPVQCYGQWFNTGRKPVLVAVLVFGFLTIMMVSRARKGAELYVRPISGIEAVDDAIGRATEMGRPILYVLGLGTAADVATIASFTILGRVAKRVAEYQTDLIVPTYDPIVMSVAQEVVKSSYLDAGRPEGYNEDSVHFVTQSQFAYVAAVNGIMLRQRPATNIYMGMFHAESLLLAETGVEAGSIQIAGTDQIAQLPFFIVACDYTLIGEELYAASAYLGREPVLLGSLKAQDYAKAAIVVSALLGLFASNLALSWFVNLFHVMD
jgi:hypothetical protein